MEEQGLEKITFFDMETNEEVSLYVLEETTLNEHKYLLVTEDDSEEAQAYIFKQLSVEGDDITYAPVEDESELTAIIKVFEELLEDTEFLV